MSTSDWRQQLHPRVRVLQIIVSALFLGCFSFLIVAVLVANLNNAVNQIMLTYVGLVMAGMILGVWIILPGIIVSQGRKKIRSDLNLQAEQGSDNSTESKVAKENREVQALMELFQTKTIVAAAMLEGAVFFLLIVYIIEPSMFSLLPAITLMILLIAKLPTTGRVTNWIEDQMRLVDEEREFG